MGKGRNIWEWQWNSAKYVLQKNFSSQFLIGPFEGTRQTQDNIKNSEYTIRFDIATMFQIRRFMTAKARAPQVTKNVSKIILPEESGHLPNVMVSL